ncbi:MAG: RsmG family class I SAM-dependent methyltransferase [Acidimicrobiales bacterium]
MKGVDLGSGAGIPGLVLAMDLPASTWTLLDANTTRTAFLVTAVQALGLADRVQVVTGRAEVVGRSSEHRGRYQVVVARAFARPAVVAECAAPLLSLEGEVVVSEPPEPADRWLEEGLTELGLRLVTVDPGPPRIATLRQDRLCPGRFPRRVGVPSKRPLW